MLNKLTEIYHQYLFSPQGENALKYLYKRGITKETLLKFKIGYCDNNIGYESVKNDFILSQLDESNLFHGLMFNPSDFFNRRIIIPLLDENDTKYFTSRNILGRSSHLHMPGSIPIPFNYNKIDSQILIIVESPINSMTLEQRGYDSIATLGIYGLKKEIIKHIKAQYLYIAFDSDKNQSGQTGALRIAELLFQDNIISYIINLPLGEDINSLYIKDKENFNIVFNNLMDTAMPCTKLDTFQMIEPQTYHRKGSYSKIVERLNLKIVNGKVKIKCPFHNDSKPSLVIWTNNNSAYCFGCNKRPTPKELEKVLF
jgi:DNA primase